MYSGETIDLVFDSIKIEAPGTSIFQSVDYVPLETRNDVLIGFVDKILTDKNYYYILDSQQKVIFIFDKQGKFVDNNSLHLKNRSLFV